jgi:membrane protein implicated in regulation of membrane protease activity
MEILSIWLIVIVMWALILVTYLISDIDLTLMIFLLLTVLVSSVIYDWLISDSARPRPKNETSGTGQRFN